MGILGSLLITAVATFSQLYASYAPERVATNAGTVTVEEPARAFGAGTGERVAEARKVSGHGREAPATGWPGQMRTYFGEHLPLIVTLWLLGVLLMQLRFLGQLAYVQRLKHYGVARFPGRWAQAIQGLEEKLNVRRHVRYVTSSRVASPLTVGWLRPAVVFPVHLLEELRQSEVIAILAHELAHIRRHDYLVGLIQGLVNTLFFFHPGVWWMNNRIGEEREHACDDLAVAATGKRVGYAKTLVELQSRHLSTPGLAMAARGSSGKGLAYRINRLIGGALTGANFQEGIMTGFILCMTAWLAISSTQLGASATDIGEVARLVDRDGNVYVGPTGRDVAMIYDRVQQGQREESTVPDRIERLQRIPTSTSQEMVAAKLAQENAARELACARREIEIARRRIESERTEVLLQLARVRSQTRARDTVPTPVTQTQNGNAQDCNCNKPQRRERSSVGYSGHGDRLDAPATEWPSWAGMVKAKNILGDRNITSSVYPMNFDNGAHQILYYLRRPAVLRSVRSHSADPLIAQIKRRADLDEGGTRVTFVVPAGALRGKTYLNELGQEDYSTITTENWTPLMDAAERGYDIAVKLLLDSGADPGIKNSGGETALSIAKRHGHDATVRLIEQF